MSPRDFMRLTHSKPTVIPYQGKEKYTTTKEGKPVSSNLSFNPVCIPKRYLDTSFSLVPIVK